MQLQLYDTYERRLRNFTPLHDGQVGLYACGPTVYDYAHIGNLRTYLFEDTLRRTLQCFGWSVRHVINITDVGHLTSDADSGEDKVEQGAKKSGQSAWQIAELYARAFKQDLRRLNALEPSVWCKATDHIAEQIHDIVEIEKRGYAYRTADGIYFDTAKLPNYGHLARLDLAGLSAGVRVAVGEKKTPSDFALWKFSRPGENRQMEWDSPWGVGFPGWHIECSAMAVKYLGAKFDIHCGGKDHIAVHHCNEIAQTEICHGTTLANFWLHGYFLQISDDDAESQKMSKSTGQFLRLDSLCERGYDPLAYRYLCLTAHYRNDLVFSWQSLDAAATALQRLREAVYAAGLGDDIGNKNAETRGDDSSANVTTSGGHDDVAGDRGGATVDSADSIVDTIGNAVANNDNQSIGGHLDANVDARAWANFMREICADLNTPRALAVVWAIAKGTLPAPTKRATLLACDRVLGLGLAHWEPDKIAENEPIPAEISELCAERDRAREAQEWQKADQLRDQIRERGYELTDVAQGSKVHRRK